MGSDISLTNCALLWTEREDTFLEGAGVYCYGPKKKNHERGTKHTEALDGVNKLPGCQHP